MPPTTTLWRPVGAYELQLIARTGFRAFPPRLPEQPIFYPVCNEGYAAQIAQRWNLDDENSGFAGFVTRFEVLSEVADRHPRRIVGSRQHEELWVPSDQLAAFCEAFVGRIVVSHGWVGPRFSEVAAWSGASGELLGDRLKHVITIVGEGRLQGGPRSAGNGA